MSARQKTEAPPVAAAASIDHVIRRLAGLDTAEAERVLKDLDPAFVREVFRMMSARMDPKSRKLLVDAARRMEAERLPKTDDELWEFVRDECSLKIPRKSVCAGHVAPFTFMADCFFERGDRGKLAVGNRGSGKTQIMGALHAVNARVKPKYTSCTVGAVESQSVRAYNFFKELVTSDKWGRIVKGRITMGKTELESGGAVEIVTGTITGVNSPHPVFAHFDEVELFRPGVYEEALNMAQSKNGYRAMNVLTSSWKKPKGFVTQLIDEVKEAERDGLAQPYEIYRWCVWETTEPCPHDCNACPFGNVKKGDWQDGSPRTFESACKRGSPEKGVGKLKFTDGFVSVEDSVDRFRNLSRRVWEAQQESKRPTMEGLIYDVFDEEAHGVSYWDPRPEYGPIVVGLDFGGTVPHAAGFWQFLDLDVEYVETDALGAVVARKTIPRGAGVRFDEVNVVNTGNAEFGRQVNQKVAQWKVEHAGFRVAAFFGDPAAKAGREEFRNLSKLGCGADIAVRFRGHVDVDPRIALVYERMANDLLYVDRERCPEWYEEVGGYERNPNTGKPYKEDDHHMDEMGYVHWNRHADERRPDGPGQAPRGVRRPRAVTVSGGERRWDPQALGSPPTGRLADPGGPDVGIASAPRRRWAP